MSSQKLPYIESNKVNPPTPSVATAPYGSAELKRLTYGVVQFQKLKREASSMENYKRDN